MMKTIDITKAYLLAFLILAAWATVAFFTMSTLITSQEKYGKLINLSGKQRTLSQKSAYYSHLFYENKVDSHVLSLLTQAMKKDHLYIINNLPSSELKQYYFNPDGLDAQVQNYFNNLETFSAEPNQNNLEKIRHTSQTLLKRLDRAVSIFEQENQNIITGLHDRELFIFLGTLITLILEAIFIIRPMIVSHKDYLQKLQIEVEKQTKDIQIFEKIFAQSNEGIIITDHNKIITNVNDSFTAITGYTKNDAIGETPRLLNSGKHDSEFYENMWREISENGIWSGEITNKRKSGEEIFEQLTIMKFMYNNEVYYASVFSDISERIDHIKELDHLATHDSLTGLLNRNAVVDRIDHAITLSNRTGMLLAVVFIDLDNFKIINDSMGHAIGDRLLQEFAKRIEKFTRKSDTLGRLGGDEFIVLMENLQKEGSEKYLLEKLIDTVNKPFEIDAYEFYVGASIGVSYYPDKISNKVKTAQNLIKEADLAMYSAKDFGKNQVVYYTDALANTVTSKMTVEQELRDAITNNELELYLQPKIEIQTGKTVGAELLLRWNKNGTIVYPDSFISVAEDSNLIIHIDQWVAQESVSIVRQFHNWGHQDFSVAFNISARSFTDLKVMDNILDTIYESRLQKYIEIEVTEGVLINNIDFASKMIKKMKSLGITVSLDDFGTGYSSFSYLSKMPFDIIKIDRSFVATLHVEKQKTLVEAIIWFSHRLNMEIVAEGIETQEQLLWLKSKNCTYGQGYYFSKPIPIDEFRENFYKLV